MKMNINMKKHVNLLGFKCKDKVTGIKGVIIHVGFDLYGCVQAVVHPGLDKKSDEMLETLWFDIARLEIIGNKPVMTPPNFDYGPAAEGLKGPSEKPSMHKC